MRSSNLAVARLLQGTGQGSFKAQRSKTLTNFVRTSYPGFGESLQACNQHRMADCSPPIHVSIGMYR